MYVNTYYRSQGALQALADNEECYATPYEEAIAREEEEAFTGWWLTRRGMTGPVLRTPEGTFRVPWAAPMPLFFEEEERVALPFRLEGVTVYAPKILCDVAGPLR